MAGPAESLYPTKTSSRDSHFRDSVFTHIQGFQKASEDLYQRNELFELNGS